MSIRLFETPVTIFVGLGYPRQVAGTTEAYKILMEWHGKRGPAHEAAINACRAAMTGDIDVETARGIFEAFARARGVLVPAIAEASREAVVRCD